MKIKGIHFWYHLKVFLRRPNYSNKVFCIGYNKTGTTSCGKAFRLLGYNNLSYNEQLFREEYKQEHFLKLLNYASKFDSFDDLPWLREDMIPLLDKVFPNSKFVYLEREEESWKKSYYNWVFKQTGQYPDLEVGLAAYRAHRAFVMDYFKDRKEDLLIISVFESDSFVRLAKFLGKETTHTQMPHENKT